MRFGTSFFNGTLFQKSIKRFWPIWTVYGVFWLFMLPLSVWSEYQQMQVSLPQAQIHKELMEFVQDFSGLYSMGVFLAVFFGVLCAMAVFSYLYSTRSCCMIHALPIRRETLFVTHYLAGLAFLLLPNLVVFGLTGALELALGCLSLQGLVSWFLIQSGLCIFFFSFAVFCAMFTGHLLALPVFYGILNSLVLMLLILIDSLCGQMLYGYVSFPEEVFDVALRLTPWYYLGNQAMYAPDYGMIVLAYAIAGLVLAGVALLVYRSRHLETAGDVVAVSWMRPVFKYGVAVCSGLAGGMITYWTFSLGTASMTVFLVLWSAVGYFAAEMLLKKSFRVWKGWKGGAVLTAVMLLGALSLQMDWYGYEHRVPALEQVEQVTVWGVSNAPYDSGNSGGVTLTDPQQIETVLALHRQIAQQGEAVREESGNDYISFQVGYEKKDGSNLSRSYYSIPVYTEEITQEGTISYLANALLSDRDYVEKLYGLEDMEQVKLTGAYIDMLWNPEDGNVWDSTSVDIGAVDELWQAVKQDFAEGNLGVRYLVDRSQERLEHTSITDLYFEYQKKDEWENMEEESSVGIYTWRVTLTPEATHTLEALTQMGVLDESHVVLTQAEYEQMDSQYPDTVMG